MLLCCTLPLHYLPPLLCPPITILTLVIFQTFVAAQLYPISQLVIGKDIGSDHYPVIITIAIKPSITKFKARKQWKFETGSWDHWSKELPAVENRILI